MIETVYCQNCSQELVPGVDHYCETKEIELSWLPIVLIGILLITYWRVSAMLMDVAYHVIRTSTGIAL